MSFELISQERAAVFAEAEAYVKKLGLEIVSKDLDRPWGGFLVLNEAQAPLFARLFFPDENLSNLNMDGKLSPKILMVAPHKRLSWQYHHRRAEIWRVISGQAGVVTSFTDDQGMVNELKTGDTVRLAQGQRHRLVGLDRWGLIAEIWQHTHPSNPSDEQDIVRLQDDFGR